MHRIISNRRPPTSRTSLLFFFHVSTPAEQLKQANMVAKGVLVSVVAGVALNQAPRTACFSNVVVTSGGRGSDAAARAPHSSRWCSRAGHRGSKAGSTAALLRLSAVEEPAAAAAASEREPDAIDLDIETQVCLLPHEP